jgi:acyl-CoA synthetase (NDP forming)
MTDTMDSLLRPRSVAVVGASDNIHKIGGRPLHYLRRHGFAGPVYPVSQRGEPIQGMRSYPHLAELPEAPDCVILSVPSTAALEQLRSCARVGARSAVLFSSGFAELGDEGRRLQETLAETARAAGLRLLGPNTIGSANFGCGAVLSFASIYQEFAAQDGPVAIVSQSGAVGASVYALLRDNGVGVRYVCTTGNQADVGISEFLGATLQDPEVRLVLLYLEEARDTAALAGALASARTRGVPVLVLPGARTAGGMRMAACHTGSEGTSDAALMRLFDDHGCRVMATLPELAASVPLYLESMAAMRAAPRVGVMSNSGASCVLAADACDALGLALAEFSAATRQRLDELLPSFSRSRNPVDLTAMLLADPGLLGHAVRAVLQDVHCDALVLSLLAVAGSGYDLPRFAAETGQAVRASRKPAVFSSPDPRVRAAFGAQGLAVFQSECEAVAALRGHATHILQARDI